MLAADRTSVRYRERRPDHAAVRSRLQEIAAVRRRFEYRRLHILLDREGVQLNHKKLRRLYTEERLQVRRRAGRKRTLGTRAPMTLPQGPNQRWSLDFASDAMADSRRFRILAVVDDFSRECLCLVARDASSGLGQVIGWLPGDLLVLSTSALIRLASTENPSPPTSPAAMHVATTPSNSYDGIFENCNRLQFWRLIQVGGHLVPQLCG